MKKNFIIPLFIFLSFISLISFSSAIATISGIPNFELGFDDFASFDIETYANNHSNNSNTISFTNPDNSAGITLFGDTGGDHTNSKFSISLSKTGFIQIISYNMPMTKRGINVCVGNNFQTQACDSFDLSILEEAGEPPEQLASLNSFFNLTALGTLNIDWNNFFTNYHTISLFYSDPITSQTVFFNKSFGQSQAFYIGGIATTIIPSNTNIRTVFQNLNNTFNQKINVTISNSQGSRNLAFNISTTATANDTNQNTFTPELVQSFQREYKINLNANYTIKLSDFAIKYTAMDTHIRDPENPLTTMSFRHFDGTGNCRLTNGIQTPATNQLPRLKESAIVTRSNGDMWVTVTAREESTHEIWFSYVNQNGYCGYNGISKHLPSSGSSGDNPPYGFNITLTFVQSGGLGGNQPGNETEIDDQRFLPTFINFFTNIYEPAQNLTSTEKWSWVVVTLIIPFLIVLALIFMGLASQLKILLWFAVIVDIFLTMFLIAISYISIYILVVLVIVMLLIIFLKSRSN